MNAQALLAKATAKVRSLNTKTLVESFEATETQPVTLELATVRDWIMTELATRNEAAFDAWMDSNAASPRAFFL